MAAAATCFNDHMPDKQQATARLIRHKRLAEAFTDDILVAPTQTTWNDFGFYIRAHVGLRRENGEREWVTAFLAFKGEKNLDLFAKRRLDVHGGDGLPLSEFDTPFASLLTESKSYSLLGRSVGIEAARRMLLAIHDISLLTAEGEDVPSWPGFFVEEPFTHAMTRASEGYFAFRQGALALAGKGTEDVDARQHLAVSLTRYGPKLSFDMDFGGGISSLRGRMAVIIGKNGCGKTNSLARLAAGLSTDKRQGVSFRERPNVNQVLVFAHSSAVRHFKQRRDRPGAASVRTFSLDPSAAISTSSRDRHTRLLVDIARSVDGDFAPLDDLKAIVGDEFNGLTLLIPLRSDLEEQVSHQVDYNGTPYVSLQYWMRGGEGRLLTAAGAVDHSRNLVFLDETGGVRELSLGQAAFLNFALTSLANAGPGSALLIDEPENFLHPNLISRFMRLLHRVVDGSKSIAIIATHSPFVVREVQSANVHVIRQGREGELEVVHPRLQTLGANVASIANEVFGDDLSEHLYELLLAEARVTEMPFEQVIERFAGELSTEALMYLRNKRQQAQPSQRGKSE